MATKRQCKETQSVSVLRWLAIAVFIVANCLIAQMFLISGVSLFDSYSRSVSNFLWKTAKICTLTEETKSALKRAKTQKCRDEIESFACRLQLENVFPSVLPNFCPRNEQMLHGCLIDRPYNRILQGNQTYFNETNSKDNCIAHCIKFGFQFAGVENRVECHCGNTKWDDTENQSIAECEVFKCPGNKSEFCGGKDMILVFSTGIQEIVRDFAVPNKEGPIGQTSDIKIVFLLIASGRYSRQIVRLVNSIYSPNHFYYIHVDKRHDYLFGELSELEKKTTNIKLKRKRFASVWGGSSRLPLVLDSIRDLFELYGDWKWDFIINLSESDFPLFPIVDLEQFLSLNRNWNFLQSNTLTPVEYFFKQGFDWAFYECEHHSWRLAEREFPRNIQIDGNSDWFVLNREFLHYVTYSEDELVKGLTLYFNHSLSAVESFFQTVLLNSKFCNTHAGTNLKFISWSIEATNRGCGCKYDTTVDWCGCSPLPIENSWTANVNYEDMQRQHMYFARKFDPTVDLTAISMVEQNVLPQSYSEDDLSYNSFWFNDFHYLDKANKVDSTKQTLLESLMWIAFNQPWFKEWTPKLTNEQVLELTVLLQIGQTFLLLKYSAQSPTTQEKLEFETKFVYKPNVSLRNQSDVTEVEVGTDWDLKAEVFRNYAKSFGTKSKLGLKVVVKGGKELKAFWFNPTGKQQGTNTFKLSNQTHVYWLDWSVNKYQSPGLWKVDLYLDGNWTRAVTFPVIPDKRLADTHNIDSSKDTYLIELISPFYSSLDNCRISSGDSTNSYTWLQLCESTDWSSLSLDTKSVFTGTD